jgi:nitrogen fixation protein FixH
VAKKKAGRPKKVVAVAAVVAKPAKTKKKKKRNLSPEGRKRIAEAVKKRWAAQKAAAAK